MERREFLKTGIAVAAGLAANPSLLRAAATPRVPSTLTPVPIQSVTIHDGFWSPKLDIWRRVTFADCFDKFESTGALANFDRVAQHQEGGHSGDPWWDGLIYEMIAAASDFLAAQSDSALAHRIDGYIERIAAAAGVDPDGYINTAVTLGHSGFRWSDPPAPDDDHDDRYPHTVYNAGCLVEAGIHHYRATGKTTLLAVATRMATFMCRIMGPPPRQNIVPGHAISEWAFTELFLLYREEPDLKKHIVGDIDPQQYLELAEFWIENRGNHQGRTDMGAYDQDDRSVFQQPVMEGHAVRACLLAAGVARASTVNGDARYGATARRWWENMVAAKMYVTGGVGAIPTTEGFGPDYELPNTGYAETCAAVANGFFSHNLSLATGRAKYVDVLERELYNGALSGVSLAGNTYYYTNHLEAEPDQTRWSWNGCPCCPPMFLKLMGMLPGCVYATNGRGIYVNLYLGSTAEIAQDGHCVTLTQTTSYPWDGHVRLAVTPPEPVRIAISLRIPDWSEGVTFRINGRPVVPVIGIGYARIIRTWRAGDVIEVNLPMPIRRIKADPRVTADVGRVALMRGPIVYCAEGQDHAGRVSSLVLTPDITLTAQHQPDMLDGVTTLHGTVQRSVAGPDDGLSAPGMMSISFTAIPFYANTNREPTDMAVWLADDASGAQPLTLAASATPSASHCNPTDSLWALNDRREPHASDDDSVPRFTWWDHRGTAEWVQYEFHDKQTVQGVEVYWWDETRVQRDCRVPQSWEVQYRDGSGWYAVSQASLYGTKVDTYNRVTFIPVHTTAVRLSVQLQSGWSGGILHWRILGIPASSKAN